MPTTSPRPAIEPDAVELAEELGARWGVTAVEVFAALVEQHSSDPVVAAGATARLTALQTGTAVPLEHLVLPVSQRRPVLLWRGGAWVDEAIHSPFPRAGYGLRPGERDRACVSTARGFHRTNPAERVARTGGTGDGVRIIVHRYGQPVAHLWGKHWAPLDASEKNPRRWAQTVYVADGGAWVDADTGGSGPAWDSDDAAVDNMLKTLVIAGAYNRNPVRWIF